MDTPTIKPAALNIRDACRYVGGVSRTTLWRKTRRHGIEPTMFGTYAVEDLNRLLTLKPAAK